MFNHKKVLSLALAGAMAASLAVPSFAANETTVTATYKEVTINVDVSTTGNVYINPYALPVKIGTGASGDVKVSEQIVTEPLTIKNKTDVKLDVNATATATINTGSTMTLATSALTKDDTAKKAFVYLDVVSATTLSGADSAVTAAAIADAYKAAGWTKAESYKEDATNLLVLNAAKATTKSGLVTLAAAELDTDGTTLKTYNAGSIAVFRLNGNCVAAPKDPWAATDGFTAKIAFTFVPNTTADAPASTATTTTTTTPAT
jgi:hypothetical protein